MQKMILIVIAMIEINSFSQNIDSDCSHYIDSLSNRKIYTFVDKMPEFKNRKGFFTSLVSNIKIDSIPQVIDTKGSVEFVVEINGNVTNGEITDTINTRIDNEVYNFIIKSKWKPGFCNNKAVPVKMIIPYRINFQ